MSDNVGGIIEGLDGFTSTREEEMRAYDALDPRLREFVSALPMSFSSVEVFEMQQRFGVEETLRLGHAMLDENFPGWTPV